MTEFFKAPEGIKVDDFFKNYVPKQFADTTASMDLSAMQGKVFTLQFNIDDKKYCLKVIDGKKLEVIEGGIDKPMVAVGLTESFWRDSVTGKVQGSMDQFTNPQQAADVRRFNALLNTKGMLDLELKTDAGDLIPIKLTFNGETTPLTKLKLHFNDWLDMQHGKADGQSLFMQGRIQFEGDMMFLMSLQQLM